MNTPNSVESSSKNFNLQNLISNQQLLRYPGGGHLVNSWVIRKSLFMFSMVFVIKASIGLRIDAGAPNYCEMTIKQSSTSHFVCLSMFYSCALPSIDRLPASAQMTERVEHRHKSRSLIFCSLFPKRWSSLEKWLRLWLKIMSSLFSFDDMWISFFNLVQIENVDKSDDIHR